MKNKLSVICLIMSILFLVLLNSCSDGNEKDPPSSGASRQTKTEISTEIVSETDFESESLTESVDTYSETEEPDDLRYYFNDYFDIKREDILAWLGSHEYDDYYLGTPYGDEYNGFNTDTCMRPNGRFYGNYPHMNCTGFVLDVLMQSSGGRSEEIHELAKNMMSQCENNGWWNEYSSYYVNEVNAYYWATFIERYENGKIEHTKYYSITDLLESRTLKKGDLIFFMPDQTVYGRNAANVPCDKYGNPIDCHIGIYWGEDNSGEDIFWHSMSAGLVGDPMDKSEGPFNQISPLTTPSVYSYVMAIPIR